MSRRRVALATAAGAIALDEDLAPLAAALAAVDVDAEPAVWDDASVPWHRYDAVVVRSTWDYAPRREAFLAWARAVAAVTRLENALDVLVWTTDKRYLSDLAGGGLPVVASRLVQPGEAFGPDDLPPGEVVVKPAVSAGAQDTARYPAGRATAAVAHVEELLAAGRAALVQPYVPSVDERGERALVYVDGAPTHTVAKGPILRPDAAVVAGLYVEEQIAPALASPAERALADAALALVTRRFGVPLYARVDIVEGAEGPCLLELELAEPSLFHAHGPGSADALAAAIVRRLDAPR